MIFKKTEENRRRDSDWQQLALLPLRDIVVFPHMVIPLFVGRERSIRALDHAMANGREIFLAAQTDAKTDEPSEDDIHEIGTVSHIMQLLRLPDGTVKVLVEGRHRARIARFVDDADHFQVVLAELADQDPDELEIEALIRSLKTGFEKYAGLEKKIPPEMTVTVSEIEDPGKLSDVLAAQLNLKLADKQALLKTTDIKARLETLFSFVQSEIEILEVQKKIRSRVKKQMEKTQREYYLNEQMQAIQRELGEKDEFRNEMSELEEQIKVKEMPEDPKDRVTREFKKLKMMNAMSAEATVVRNYIDWVLSLPWALYTDEALDIERAGEILDEDHYGLRKPKERILEYLAVSSLVEKMRGPILCFVGPPGVGKTSLGRSIARATGRNYVRLSLGGVRDEAEIRGHRRTYIGALPGKIIQSLKRSESNNPVFLLDEVDKMSMDFRGDPSAALLEVLDPEQNNGFGDHYLDLDYDLSRVMFITTANTLDGIPWPLRDRMEIIELHGYTEDEKHSIAQKFLVPKQRAENGLVEDNIHIRSDAVRLIIRRYTKEAGVRSLERDIAKVCRKVAKEVVAQGRDHRVVVGPGKIKKFLGVPRFLVGEAEQQDQVGLVNGLAWTQFGGEMLGIEATVMPGKGKLLLTGQLGKVFQESAQGALSYIRTRTQAFGLPEDFYQHLDIHVHLPGFRGTDGPSAGISITTAMVSALLQIPVRHQVAMTGEVTLRGQVRAIGGLKEKSLAAHRGLVDKLLIPKENDKDIREIPRKIRRAVEIVTVDHMDQVLRHALALEDPERLFKAHEPGPLFTRAIPSPDGGAEDDDADAPGEVIHSS
jgi:ATP-dependent Lon protease